jgi:hypothetical protein
VKTIGLLPVRNEAWILPHSLACLSGFCDVILVNDQNSGDSTREICRQFPKVVLVESPKAEICEIGRWQLLDVARDYDGQNLLWCSDADELLSPALYQTFLSRERDRLTPGTVIEARFYHLWGRRDKYRDDNSPYAPYWKAFALVDSRATDFDRSERLPLHQPRVPVGDGQVTLRADDLHVLHLQWLISDRNQMKQAWYRCREWLDGRRAAEINARYSITFPAPRARTSPVPPEWTRGLSFPDTPGESEASWQERDILEWLDEYGVEFFEPLELWHIAKLRTVFESRTGRQPKPDRSYLPSLTDKARQLTQRVVRGARRRLLP